MPYNKRATTTKGGSKRIVVPQRYNTQTRAPQIPQRYNTAKVTGSKPTSYNPNKYQNTYKPITPPTRGAEKEIPEMKITPTSFIDKLQDFRFGNMPQRRSDIPWWYFGNMPLPATKDAAKFDKSASKRARYDPGVRSGYGRGADKGAEKYQAKESSKTFSYLDYVPSDNNPYADYPIYDYGGQGGGGGYGAGYRPQWMTSLFQLNANR